MIELNAKDLFAIFEKQLRLFYPTFKDKKLNMKYIFDMDYAFYNYVERKLYFNNYILYFQFEEDCLRRFSYQEAVRMIKREYPESKVTLSLYIDNELNDIEDEESYKDVVNFYCIVEIDDVELTGDQLSSLIDLALDTRSENCDNSEWLTELSLRYQRFLKLNS
ncbi:hypothetical protein [Paenibacillus silvae]|uniref:IDEAL domain-containing protein n=1 Tax=Paenibacillus silvae TaxID=1325358 RepID=A0A2W6N979_9BACL|nr:hypothetical protein [Paenibacillus silvae]PZT52199.1 hypothetical protein DN757_28575 [Paenibacillus silvae]